MSESPLELARAYQASLLARVTPDNWRDFQLEDEDNCKDNVLRILETGGAHSFQAIWDSTLHGLRAVKHALNGLVRLGIVRHVRQPYGNFYALAPKA